MSNILAAYLLPHPPILLKEIGRGEEEKAKATITGMENISKDIRSKSPSTIVVITPHGPLFKDAISISTERNLEGNFARFGHSELSYRYKNNIELVEEIIINSAKKEIPLIGINKEVSKDYNLDCKLDHGTLVPLYFVDKEYKDYKLVHITYGLLSPDKLHKFGREIKKSINNLNEDAVIIASGDLSHKLLDKGPYTYSAKGKIFDEEIVNIIKEARIDDIISFDLDLAEEAGECGLRSLMVMAGVMDRYELKTELESYEGPFGVGYATAKIEILDEVKSEYVKLAKESVEYYIKNGEYMPEPKNINGVKKGVFVTLKKFGILRGCIGTIFPTKDSVELEIIQNAVSAAISDPRFTPIKNEDLDELEYSVDILSEPEAISSLEELDINKYGVIVYNNFRKGLLLPNLEGIDSVEEQVSIALQKAGIRANEEYQMERFEVKRYY